MKVWTAGDQIAADDINANFNGSADYVVATGSGGAFVLTYSPAITALNAGMRLRFKANHTPASTATVNPNGLGAVAIQMAGNALSSGVITTDDIIEIIYDGAAWQMINTPASLVDGSVTQLHSHPVYSVFIGADVAVPGTGATKGYGVTSGVNAYLNYADAAQNDATFGCVVPNGVTTISAIEVFYRNDVAADLYIKSVIGVLDMSVVPGTALLRDTTGTLRTYATSGATGTSEVGKISLNGDVFDGLPTLAAGDVVSINLLREANNAADTWNAPLYVLGIKVTFA